MHNTLIRGQARDRGWLLSSFFLLQLVKALGDMYNILPPLFIPCSLTLSRPAPQHVGVLKPVRWIKPSFLKLSWAIGEYSRLCWWPPSCSLQSPSAKPQMMKGRLRKTHRCLLLLTIALGWWAMPHSAFAKRGAPTEPMEAAPHTVTPSDTLGNSASCSHSLRLLTTIERSCFPEGDASIGSTGGISLNLKAAIATGSC